MQNKVSEGNVLTITAPAGGLTGGQAYMLGEIPLVVCADADEGELVAAERRGVFELSVKGHDGSADAGIAAGAQIYFDDTGETALLNVNNSEAKYGKVLSAVSSGATATVEVLLDE